MDDLTNYAILKFLSGYLVVLPQKNRSERLFEHTTPPPPHPQQRITSPVAPEPLPLSECQLRNVLRADASDRGETMAFQDLAFGMKRCTLRDQGVINSGSWYPKKTRSPMTLNPR